MYVAKSEGGCEEHVYDVDLAASWNGTVVLVIGMASINGEAGLRKPPEV
ncbi:hypothetical protein MTY414_42190 [Mycolicibacterium mageritense]|nr:hypothetical protein MTY414_42190 [Mycolicibacterium mageritense]